LDFFTPIEEENLHLPLLCHKLAKHWTFNSFLQN
jgi:hypothetical protein